MLGRVGGASSLDAARTRTLSLCRSPASPTSRAWGSGWQWHCAHGTVTGKKLCPGVVSEEDEMSSLRRFHLQLKLAFLSY